MSKVRTVTGRPDTPSAECHVVPHNGEWSIRRAGSNAASELYATQGEAVRAAQALVQSKGGGMCVHEKDGRVRDTFTVGRDTFAKISAIEGISLTREGRVRAAEFNRRGLSSSERRTAIIDAYRSKG